MVKHLRACNRLTIFDTGNPLSSFGAGWYYGGVPIATQGVIDRGIMTLTLQGKVQQLLSQAIDVSTPLTCAALPIDIPPGILGWHILNITLICTLAVLALATAMSWMKRSDDPDGGEDDVLQFRRPLEGFSS